MKLKHCVQNRSQRIYSGLDRLLVCNPVVVCTLLHFPRDCIDIVKTAFEMVLGKQLST